MWCCFRSHLVSLTYCILSVVRHCAMGVHHNLQLHSKWHASLCRNDWWTELSCFNVGLWTGLRFLIILLPSIPDFSDCFSCVSTVTFWRRSVLFQLIGDLGTCHYPVGLSCSVRSHARFPSVSQWLERARKAGCEIRGRASPQNEFLFDRSYLFLCEATLDALHRDRSAVQ